MSQDLMAANRFFRENFIEVRNNWLRRARKFMNQACMWSLRTSWAIYGSLFDVQSSQLYQLGHKGIESKIFRLTVGAPDIAPSLDPIQPIEFRRIFHAGR